MACRYAGAVSPSWLKERHSFELENPGETPATVTVTFRGRTKSPGLTEVMEACD